MSTGAFNVGWSAAGNTFWKIYDGLHAGAEVTLGGRSNYDESWGTVVRVSGLIYYEL